MKNKRIVIICLAAVLVVCIATCVLIFVNKKQGESNATVVLASNKELNIYDLRSNAEEILGDNFESSRRAIFRYDDFSVAYTDGKLSYVIFDGDSGLSLGSGIKIGSSTSDLTDNGFNIVDSSAYLYYKVDDGKLILSEKPEIDKSVLFGDYVTVSAMLDDGIVESISVGDLTTLRLNMVDEQ